MKAINYNKALIEGYLKLLENLSPGNKLDLISLLTLSVKTDMGDKKNSEFFKAFGAWKSKESADELIHKIKESRTYYGSKFNVQSCSTTTPQPTS